MSFDHTLVGCKLLIFDGMPALVLRRQPQGYETCGARSIENGRPINVDEPRFRSPNCDPPHLKARITLHGTGTPATLLRPSVRRLTAISHVRARAPDPTFL